MMGKIGAAFARLAVRSAKGIPGLLWNLIGLAGAGAIAYGVWTIYKPAGFIAGGVLLLVGAAVLAPRDA